MKQTPKNYLNILSMERKVILNFVKKDLLALFHVIKKVSLPSFASKSKESTKFKPSKENTTAKVQAIAQKQVHIGKSRFISMS